MDLGREPERKKNEKAWWTLRTPTKRMAQLQRITNDFVGFSLEANLRISPNGTRMIRTLKPTPNPFTGVGDHNVATVIHRPLGTAATELTPNTLNRPLCFTSTI